MHHTFLRAVTLVAALAVCFPAGAVTVWGGPPVTFTKASFANPALPANQDRLTANVALTRASTQGLYNAVLEDFYGAASPADTRWAFAGLNGNPTTGFSAANHLALTFLPWATSLNGQSDLAQNIIARPGVVHLISEDIYVNITFTVWQAGGAGGAFSYTRASPGDTDGDGVPNSTDNCTLVPNASQLDTNGDGYGNICDADLNGSGLTTTADFNLLRSVLNASSQSSPLAAAADMNSSGLVTVADFNLLRARINTAPGPSGLHP